MALAGPKQPPVPPATPARDPGTLFHLNITYTTQAPVCPRCGAGHREMERGDNLEVSTQLPSGAEIQRYRLAPSASKC